MGRTLDFFSENGFPVTLPFSKANPAASATETLALPQGNGYIVPEGYYLHPLILSCKTNAAEHEHIANGGFETAGEGEADVFASWTEAAGNGAIAQEAGVGNFHSGTKSAKLTTGADLTVKVTQEITVIAGNTYDLSFEVKGDAVNKAQFGIYDNSNTEDILALTEVAAATAAFFETTQQFTAPAGCTSVIITMQGAGVEGAIAYFDDVSVVTVACATPTAAFNVAADGVQVAQPCVYLDDAVTHADDESHVNLPGIEAGKEVTVQMVTTANYYPATADVDAVLLGVLKPV